MTQQNLQAAFAGESQAHMRYLAFSEIAEKEGRPNTARLFKAIAYAEQVHATNHLRVLGGLDQTVKNLDVAINGETFEIEEMYPVYVCDAQLQKEAEAEKSANYALEAEKIHAQMYKKAKQAVAEGKDIELAEMFICSVCGYTIEAEIPDFCPLCGVKKEAFKKF
jgi:rubrerythrin